MRTAAAMLGVVTAYVLPPVGAMAWAALSCALLAGTGVPPRAQVSAAARWWPVALLILAVHLLTTTAAAPLGRPSWAGLAAGAGALARVAAGAAWLAAAMRTTGIGDLASALQWWLSPFGRHRHGDGDAGLVLAVALGTAPGLLGEARRIDAVCELRRHGPGARPRRLSLARRFLDRAAVIVPLMESVLRRADALSLALRRRRPQVPGGHPPWLQLAGLALWALALVLGLTSLPDRGWPGP